MGTLYVDGVFECFTLEDTDRYAYGLSKVPAQTAIDVGTFNLVITMSPRFKRELPLLVGVPNFEGIRIHPGNTPSDTEGCILVGNGLSASGTVTESRAAFEVLMRKLRAANSERDIQISRRMMDLNREYVLKQLKA